MTSEPLYTPAKRRNAGLLIGMSGPSGSGKTVSALRLARGLVGPEGKIALLDTESGRALLDADDYEFDHGPLNEPFSPDRYVAAAAIAKNSGHDVLIIDSMSHEWSGPGGVLDWHEKELDRLTKGSTDYAYRENMSMAAWARPKAAHKAMVQRLLQMNFHVIFCFRAEQKIKIQLLPNKAGKLVNTPVPQGFQPITDKEMAFELTIFLGFEADRPGVPLAIKLGDKFKPFVPLDRQVGEDSGVKLAAWARGEKPTTTAETRPVQVRPPSDQPATTPTPAATGNPVSEQSRKASQQPSGPGHWRTIADDEILAPGAHVQMDMSTGQNMLWQPDPPAASPPPAGELPFPGDLPLDPPPKKAKPTVAETIAALKVRFEAAKVRADHLAIVDQKENRDRISWLKKNHREAAAPLVAAMEASWERTIPQKEPV